MIEKSDTPGELVYQGANVSMGYAENCFDLCKGDENHGVLHTGDIAKRDVDGFYYIVGRKKRFLKVYGNRINLDEVEQSIQQAGYVCACAGEDDHLKIYVTNQEDRGRIRDYIAEKTHINRAGITVIYIDEIPRNAAGKVLYSALN
jgi:acyl-CoA synthetase (AMP-forming)/AMP-acid ligase II